MNDIYEVLLEHIRTLEVIDTHEHLNPHEHLREQNTDILCEYLSHYFSCDLVSAGLSPTNLEIVRNTSRPLMERWRIVEPYWNFARFTGYGRALDRTVNMLYGLPGITGDTLEAADTAFKLALRGGRQYHHVLKELCNIRTSILDVTTLDCDRTYFTPVFAAHEWIHPSSLEAMMRLTKKQGIRLHTLNDYEQALRAALVSARDQGGICSIKCSLAYMRSLRFDRPSRADAESAFARAMAFSHAIAWQDRPRPDEVFEDHMMHYVCHLAGELQLPYQIHTGLQEGNGNLLSSSDPMLLNNLFFEYPETRFDIFHIGYPWHIQLAALAKNFQNVNIDMCWSHIISPNAAIGALCEYLDAVPLNKIMAFGGDYCFIDAVVAHLEQARENVAHALAHKISIGMLDIDQARHIARMLFFDNPAALFGIKK